MKLIKEEIEFIEHYLIKNGVKYWDVRIELLDHIVSAVEDKIEQEGVSFNEALLDVHQSFGNRTKTFGIYNDKLMKTGLYADNNGFKKFTRKKQKELGRKYRNLTLKELKKMLVSPAFLLEYTSIILLFVIVFQYWPKTTGFIGLVVLMLPYFFSAFHSLKDKSTRKSLNIMIVGNMGFLFFSLYNLGIQIFNSYYEAEIHKPFIIFAIMTCLLYPIMRTNINVYFLAYKEHKNMYELMLT
ncbi:hypothetical protein [uncultured Lacinutrix sp.]|uniref:hypothetical protein n=1 Tax=uncultured Lacinutrix sp. TaxID=574032 RepID=UPI0026282045|nr:hypothetical protein [uncultured Lacinutrix sp.]